MKTITNTIYLVFAVVALACVALAPQVRGVDPPPDGGYPNQTTAEGEDALLGLTNGMENTGLGYHALYLDTTGGDNTGAGAYALEGNKTGSSNTAFGVEAMRYSSRSVGNTAIGTFALLFDSVGGGNTGTGYAALGENIFGNSNTAVGNAALLSNEGGDKNTAIGAGAMSGNEDEFVANNDNTAVGYSALYLNGSGNNNVANGSNSLYSNISGSNNTVSGFQALYNNINGSNNTANGANALLSNTTGANNIGLGAQAGQNLTTGNNNIDIGDAGLAGESRAIRIGTTGLQEKTFVAGIWGATVPNGVGVIVGSNGRLGTVLSSERFKDAIRPMDKASEAIFALRPVTFRYKRELDPSGTRQFGLVAEEVQKVDVNLVANDDRGKPLTVRYEAVNAMLLNEFLKEHKAFVEEERSVEELKKQVAALTAGLQKVSTEVEMSKHAPETVSK